VLHTGWLAAIASAALSIACNQAEGAGRDGGGARSGEDAGPAGMSGAGGAPMTVDAGPVEIATEEASREIAGYACDVSEACAGDPSGSWEIREFCLFDPVSVATTGLPLCDGLLRGYERVAEGTLLIDAAGSFEIDMQVTGTQHVVIDDECARSSGSSSGATAESCATFERQFNVAGADNSAACTFEDRSCVCEIQVLTNIAVTTEIEILEQTLRRGREVIPFCVEDDALTLEFTDGTRRMQLMLARE
jgi:hypothetical protein